MYTFFITLSSSIVEREYMKNAMKVQISTITAIKAGTAAFFNPAFIFFVSSAFLCSFSISVSVSSSALSSCSDGAVSSFSSGEIAKSSSSSSKL